MVFYGHGTKRTAGIGDLDPVVVPRHPDRRIGGLVAPVHDRVADDLLERRHRVEGATLLPVSAGEVHRDPVVAAEFLIRSPKHLRHRAIDQLFVGGRRMSSRN